MAYSSVELRTKARRAPAFSICSRSRESAAFSYLPSRGRMAPGRGLRQLAIGDLDGLLVDFVGPISRRALGPFSGAAL